MKKIFLLSLAIALLLMVFAEADVRPNSSNVGSKLTPVNSPEQPSLSPLVIEDESNRPERIVPYHVSLVPDVGDNCDDPIVINLPADLPYTDVGQTTCGRINDYEQTCLGYYDGGEDIIYELVVTEEVTINIMIDPYTTSWTGILIDSLCPPSGCPYTPGDANGDGNAMGNDVTYSVRYFKGIGSPPPDSCPYDGGWLYSAGDANGNCSYTGSDVTFLVAFFKGSNPEILYCEETPPGEGGPLDCMGFSTSPSATTRGMVNIQLGPGSYYIMVDTYPTPDCITIFDLMISESVPDMAVGMIRVPTDVFDAHGIGGVAGEYGVRIVDVGGIAATVDANLTIFDPNSAPVHTSSITGVEVPAGADTSVYFPDLFTPTVNGNYTIEVEIIVPDDTDPSNNTKSRVLTVCRNQVASYYDPEETQYRYIAADFTGWVWCEMFTALEDGFLSGGRLWVAVTEEGQGGDVYYGVWPTYIDTLDREVPDLENPLFLDGPYTIPGGQQEFLYEFDFTDNPIVLTAGQSFAIGHMNDSSAYCDVSNTFETPDDGFGRDLWWRPGGDPPEWDWYLNGYGDWFIEAFIVYPNQTNPEVAVNPSEFDEVIAPDRLVGRMFTLTNMGAVGTPDLSWSVSGSEAWLQNFNPSSGSLPGLESVDIDFEINTAGLDPYTDYDGNIVITSNDPLSPFNLPVHLFTASTPTDFLAESGNFDSCAVSNHGRLGDSDNYGNTYNWNELGSYNYEGTFILGNSSSTMMLDYGNGENNKPFRATADLDSSDSFHPITQFDDGDSLYGGLVVDYQGYGFPGADTGDFFIHEYVITNNSGSAITSLYAACYFDWDIGSADTIAFDRANNLIIQKGWYTARDTTFFGIALVSGSVNTLFGVSQDHFVYPWEGWNADTLYAYIGVNDDIQPYYYNDMSSLVSYGPFDLANGESETVAFAIIGGASQADVAARAVLALSVYQDLVGPIQSSSGKKEDAMLEILR